MKFPTQIRTFNKHILNPVLGRIARSSHGPFAIIRHVGRRSGKTYETPVIVFAIPGGFVLALTYGKEVDWYRNVTAAGSCVVIWHRREYAVNKIEPITLEAALPSFHQPEKTILKLIRTQHFIRMTHPPDGKPQPTDTLMGEPHLSVTITTILASVGNSLIFHNMNVGFIT